VLARQPHAARFEMRGRQMDGWLRVDAEGLRSRRQLERWVQRGVTYARALPPKSASPALGALGEAASVARYKPGGWRTTKPANSPPP